MSAAKRRIRFHRRISLIVALAVSLVVAYAIIKKSNVLPYRLSKYINEHYLSGSGFQFTCGSIKGDLVSHVVLENVKIAAKIGTYDLFSARRIELDYSIFEILKLNLVIDELKMKGASINLRRGPGGRMLLPQPHLDRSTATSANAPHIEIHAFSFENVDLTVEQGSKAAHVKDLDLKGRFNYSGGAGEIEVTDSRALLEDSGTPVNSLRFRIGFSPGSTILRDFTARLDRSYIMINGEFSGSEIDRLQFVFNPVDLKEISSLGLNPANSGEVGGSLNVSGTRDSLDLEGTITGKAFGLLFSGFSFEGFLAGSRLQLSSVEGKVFGSYVKGRMGYVVGDEGGYSFSGVCRGLDISQGFLPGDGVPDTDFTGTVDFKYDSAANTYLFSADLDTSAIAGYRSRKLRLRGSWTEKNGMSLAGIEFLNDGFTISGKGGIDPSGKADLIFDVQGDSLDYLWDYLSLPRLQCRTHLRGKAEGYVNDLEMHLNGAISRASFLFAAVDTGTVKAELLNVPSDSVIARVDVKGDAIDLAGSSFQSPHILLEAGAGTIKVKDFSFSKGDTFITSDFDISSRENAKEIVFKHMMITLPEERWMTARPAVLRIEGDRYALDSLRFTSKKGELAVDLSYDAARKEIELSAEGDNVESSILARSLGLPFKLEGKCGFEVTATGSVDDPALTLSFGLSEGSLDELRIGRLDLAGEYDASVYTLKKLVLVEREDSLVGSGVWKLGRSPLELSRKEVGKEDLLASAMEFTCLSYRYPVGRILRLFDKSPPLDLAYSGSITISGNPTRSKLAAKGTVAPAESSSVRFPDVELFLVCEDDSIKVKSLSFDDGRAKGTLTGTVPAEFDLVHGFRPLRESPLRLEFSLDASDLSGLEDYFDFIDDASGRLAGRVEIAGTLVDPRFSGSLDFRDCSLKLSSLEEEYRKMEGRVVMLGNLVQLAALNGRSGKKGSFFGSGYLELSGFRPVDYRVDFNFNDLPFASIHDFTSIQDGVLTVKSRGEEKRRLTPEVTGRLKIKQATITFPIGGGMAKTSPLAVPTDNPRWFGSIDINAPKKIFVKNPGLNMELGGDVILKRDETGLYLRGELNVLRGSYNLYGNKFKITDGFLDFSTATSFRPEISINAYNLYRHGEIEHRVYLNLSWPRDKKEPHVTLSSDDPLYSETDIWKMLGGSFIPSGDAGANAGGWDAAGTARSLASNYFESLLNARMKDMTIDVESRSLGSVGKDRRQEQEMTVAVGKYLSEDLYLKYRQGLSITTEREVDIEYRLGNMLILRSQIIRHSGNRLLGKSSQATDEINFDIKLRFEY